MSYIYIYIYIYFYTYMTNLRKMTLPIAFIPSCLGPRFKISGDPSVLMPCAPCDRTRWPSTEPLPHASLAQGSLDLAFAGFVPQQLRYSIWPPVFLFFLISLEGFVRVFNWKIRVWRLLRTQSKAFLYYSLGFLLAHVSLPYNITVNVIGGPGPHMVVRQCTKHNKLKGLIVSRSISKVYLENNIFSFAFPNIFLFCFSFFF